MPEHTTWFTFVLQHIQSTLAHNTQIIGTSYVAGKEATWLSFEPILMSLVIAGFLVVVGIIVSSKENNVDDAVIPDDSLTLRTFMEAFLGYFYDLASSVMDPARAKKYFPLIATSSCFVFFSNILALMPGMPVPTTSLSITLGTALVVFILFNIYGLLTNGMDYIKHLMGPAWYLAPLIFPIEVISLSVRPITLAVRLMLNMAVDHLILSIMLGLCAIILPLPVMILGCLVVVVQTLVFTLLTCIYIGLATEHAEH